MLGESLVVALLGGLSGMVFAWFLVPVLVRLMPSDLSRLDNASVDGWALLFCLGLSLLVGLVAGGIPLLRMSRPNLSKTLRQATPKMSGGRSQRAVQSGLVVFQVALLLVLMAGAALLWKSFDKLRSIDPGFRVENLITLSTYFPTLSFPEQHQRVAFLEQAQEAIGALPGVEGVAVTTSLPMGDRGFKARLSVEGRAPQGESEILAANHREVSSDYLRLAGMKVLEGRTFDRQDHADNLKTVVVSRTMAERYWPDRSPVGKRVKRGGPDSTNPWLTVVGVVDDVKESSLDEVAEPTWYLPYAQHSFQYYKILVRTNKDPMPLLPQIRETIWDLNKDQPLYNIRTLEGMQAGTLSVPRFRTFFLGLLAVVGLILTAAGVFGVMSHFVTQHRSELGVRIALGAQGRQVLGLVLGRTAMLILGGMVAGIGTYLLLQRLLASLLFDVSSADPTVLAAVCAALFVSMLGSAWLPAWRASRVDPVKVLKSE
jgi:predicted permease